MCHLIYMGYLPLNISNLNFSKIALISEDDKRLYVNYIYCYMHRFAWRRSNLLTCLSIRWVQTSQSRLRLYLLNLFLVNNGKKDKATGTQKRNKRICYKSYCQKENRAWRRAFKGYKPRYVYVSNEVHDGYRICFYRFVKYILVYFRRSRCCQITVWTDLLDSRT